MASDTCACAVFHFSFSFLLPSLSLFLALPRSRTFSLPFSFFLPLAFFTDRKYLCPFVFFFLFDLSVFRSFFVRFVSVTFALFSISVPYRTGHGALNDLEKSLWPPPYAHASGCHIGQEVLRDIQLEYQQRTGMSLVDYPLV